MRQENEYQLSENVTTRMSRGGTFFKGTFPLWKMPDLVITPCGGNWQKCHSRCTWESMNSTNPPQKTINGLNSGLGIWLQSLDDLKPLSLARAWTFQLLAKSYGEGTT